jgi:single-strand DNA-binding protein
LAKSINKVILVGNVGKDPEVKYTPNGIPLAKFSLATNERFKDKSGEWQDRTEWHNVLAWQRLAEIVGEFVQKGSKLYIEGKLQISSWEVLGSPERSDNADRHIPEAERESVHAGTGETDDSDIPF